MLHSSAENSAGISTGTVTTEVYLPQYTLGSITPCFIGDPTQVAEIVDAQVGALFPAEYTQWGWRYKRDTATVDAEAEYDLRQESTWRNWNVASESVLLAGVDEQDPMFQTLRPCR
ncbi:MAG: hypothetical protein SFX73_05180 [Kofleriaceae bacterium]|nr:hypothetical protein [Kofleriaceae bacterium]